MSVTRCPAAGLRRSGIRLATIVWMVLWAAPRGRAQTPDRSLLGAWDLTLATPDGDRPSWIRITDAENQPRLWMVGTVGHATPLHATSLAAKDLRFTVTPGDDIGFDTETVFAGRLVDGALVGTADSVARAGGGPGNHRVWRGMRAPALQRSGAPRWGDPIALYDGRSLTGWSLRDPRRPGTWSGGNGVLTTDGHGSDLISSGLFADFRLHLEFRCGARANTGVFLRGRYEVQIETDSAAEPASHHTGGVYGFLAPEPEQPRRADLWQTMDITLVGREITVVQNGMTVIDHRTIPGITGGALDSREAEPGPIVLQGSEGGRIGFRNIVLIPAMR